MKLPFLAINVKISLGLEGGSRFAGAKRPLLWGVFCIPRVRRGTTVRARAKALRGNFGKNLAFIDFLCYTMEYKSEKRGVFHEENSFNIDLRTYVHNIFCGLQFFGT